MPKDATTVATRIHIHVLTCMSQLKLPTALFCDSSGVSSSIEQLQVLDEEIAQHAVTLDSQNPDLDGRGEVRMMSLRLCLCVERVL